MQFTLLALCFAQLSTFSHGLPVIEQRSAPIVLGLAKTFGAISATTLTSTGNTVITGNAGTYPGTSITGFPPGKATGALDAGNTAASNVSLLRARRYFAYLLKL